MMSASKSRSSSMGGGSASPAAEEGSETHTKRKINKNTIEASIRRLAVPSDRVEYIDTPGPYNYEDTREKGKIPYVFRTSNRWPKPPPPMKDRIEFNLAAVEPKQVHVVFSTESRFPKTHTATSDASGYDVEGALTAIEKRTFAATFGSRGKHFSKPVEKEGAQEASFLRASGHQTIAGTAINGGAMSHGERDTSAAFILHTESPGPIYNPSYNQVTAGGASGVFSSQLRMPTERHDTPSSLAYADSVTQAEHLSTTRRSPSCHISRVPKVLPLPFTVHNMCNSRSMRTLLCKMSSEVVSANEKKSHQQELAKQKLARDLYQRSMGVEEGRATPSATRPSSRSSSRTPVARPESAARWVAQKSELRSRSADPGRYVVCDSPFASRHHVPNAVRTLVLEGQGSGAVDDDIQELAKKIIRDEKQRSSSKQPSSTKGNRSASSRPATAGVKPSSAVGRLRQQAEAARAKRSGGGKEDTSHQGGADGGGSPPPRGGASSSSPARPSSSSLSPAGPRRYEPKYPVFAPDEGYHCASFTNGVKQHIDDHRPLHQRERMPEGVTRWEEARTTNTLSPPPPASTIRTDTSTHSA